MAATDDCLLAIDIGGTKLVVGVASQHLRDFETGPRIPTPPSAEAAVAAIEIEADRLLAGRRVAGIGVSFGGHVRGRSLTSLHVKGWSEVDLEDRLGRRYFAPIHIVNDGEASALAEWHGRIALGARVDSLLYVTVSTGVGGGAVLDGTVWRGSRGLSMEIGHLPVEGDDECPCGRTGHVEAVASGRSIRRRALRAVDDPSHAHSALTALVHARGNLTARDVADVAEQGDELALSIMADAGAAIGRAIASACLLLDTEIVAIGGGVATAGPSFWHPLHTAVLDQLTPTMPVEHAVLGNDNALYGALYTARSAARTRPCRREAENTVRRGT